MNGLCIMNIFRSLSMKARNYGQFMWQASMDTFQSHQPPSQILKQVNKHVHPSYFLVPEKYIWRSTYIIMPVLSMWLMLFLVNACLAQQFVEQWLQIVLQFEPKRNQVFQETGMFWERTRRGYSEQSYPNRFKWMDSLNCCLVTS